MLKKSIQRTPLNRSIDVTHNGDGSSGYRCFDVSDPQYYKNESGTLNPIDVGENLLVTSKIGKILLRKKNVISSGIRTDGSTRKYIGLRPDENQSEQLEFSIEAIEYDGISIPIDLSKSEEIDDQTIDLGNCVVQNTNSFTRQMVKVEHPIDDFKVTYKIHLTNLLVANDLIDEEEILRASINAPKFIDGGRITTEEWQMIAVENLSKPDFVVGNCQTMDKTVTKGTVDDIFEILPEGFSVDSTNAGVCTSLLNYGKLHFGILNAPKDYGLHLMMTLVLSELAGMTVTAEETAFILNGKEIGRFACGPGYIVGAIDTLDLTELRKTIFKDPSEIGHIDTTQKEFAAAMKKNVVDRFKNSCNEIKIGSKHYVPDDAGRFIINDNEGTFRFAIYPPVLLDKELNAIQAPTLHTLKQNEDGTLEYTKYPSADTVTCGVLNSVAYIDVYTCYHTTPYALWTSILQATWANARNGVGSAVAVNPVQPYHGASFVSDKYGCIRNSMVFDTTGIPSGATVTAVDMRLYSFYGTGAVASYIVDFNPASETTLVNSDWSNFGSTSWGNWYCTSTSILAYDITLSSGAYSNINCGGKSFFGYRNFHDYNNSTPTAGYWTYIIPASAPYITVTATVASTSLPVGSRIMMII